MMIVDSGLLFLGHPVGTLPSIGLVTLVLFNNTACRRHSLHCRIYFFYLYIVQVRSAGDDSSAAGTLLGRPMACPGGI